MPRWPESHRLRSALAVASLSLLLAGCGTTLFKPVYYIQGDIPRPKPSSPPTVFQAGASRVDLTPIPGIGMNYSMDGKVSRGFWTRLFARAIYFETPSGKALVFVSADLPHIPNGLSDQVAELVSGHSEIDHLGRAQIVLAATHTHNGPENFFSDAFYNGFPSPRAGFDPSLFDFLARRITDAIRRAHARREPAKLNYREAMLNEFFRNRSIVPFRLNDDAASFLSEDNKDTKITPTCNRVEAQTDDAICGAVWPKVEILEIVKQGGADDGRRLATAVFLAAHPTVLGSHTQVFQGDVFGVAARLVEQKRVAACDSYDAPPVVALFNGAQGDASIEWEEGRRNRWALLNQAGAAGDTGYAVRLARTICGGGGSGVVDSLGPEARSNTDIAYQFSWLELANQSTDSQSDSCEPWHERCTTPRPIPGAASMGGAQDGRTIWYEIGAKEGLRSSATGDHGRKAVGIDAAGDPIRIADVVANPDTAPDKVPVGVYRIGGLFFVSLPGEFTAVMGNRIRKAVAAAAAPVGTTGEPPDRVMLIGLANGHVSYVTTPEEYDAQFYEGASNIYGAATGPLFQARLVSMASKLDVPDDTIIPLIPLTTPYKYEAGMCRVFQPRDAGLPTFEPDDGLGNILLELGGATEPKNQARGYARQCWIDAIPNLRRVPSECVRAVPYVWVEKKAAVDDAQQCTGMFSSNFGRKLLDTPCDAFEHTPCGPDDPRHCAAVSLPDPAGDPDLLPKTAKVPQDNCGIDVVTALHGAYEDRTRWCAWWMPPAGEDPDDYAICVAGVTGENVVQAGAVVPGRSTDGGLSKPLDRFPDRDSDWISRLLASWSECNNCPTQDVCEWPSLE